MSGKVRTIAKPIRGTMQLRFATQIQVIYGETQISTIFRDTHLMYRLPPVEEAIEQLPLFERKIVRALQSKLVGEAEDIVGKLAGYCCDNELLRDLRDRFVNKNVADGLAMKLGNAKQQADDDMRKFGCTIRSLYNKAVAAYRRAPDISVFEREAAIYTLQVYGLCEPLQTLWELLNAENSHVAQMAVPLLLHCVKFKYGSDTFWSIVEENFNHDDWRTRFSAVGKVTLISRFMNQKLIESSPSLQTIMANILCYLIKSMDDCNVHVAQKATLYLGTIHDTAIKAFLTCLENQFDLVIIDRPIILQTLYQLHNCLSDRKVISWNFFLNRFDSIFLEAQIILGKLEGVNMIRGLHKTLMSL
uniref:Uncharacterized protein n=1 Tax=Trichogramma kaykai TaxID=54128 RepID=A0ABD2W2F2_9HYME